MGTAVLLGVLALVALRGGSATGQECKRCTDTGLAVCPDATRHACTGPAALRCSVAARCEACAGTGLVPCAKCKRPPAAAHAQTQAANRAWLVEVEPIDKTIGRPLAHAKSAHFLLTFDIPTIDVDKKLPLHDGMHLYVERLEELFTRFTRELGAAEADFLGPTHVLLWSRKSDQEKASLVFTRQSSSTESKLMGKAPVVSIFYDEEWLHEEFELHQAVVHQVTHCLLSNVWDGIWPGNIHGGWIDEGLAHAYEIALFGGVRHYCYIEADTILDIHRGGWEPPVREAVERGTAPGFVGVAGKNTTELTPEDQLFAWSYVDYLQRVYPARLGPIARAVKSRKSIKDVLSETLSVTPFQFEENWRAWVKETYALKEKKKRG